MLQANIPLHWKSNDKMTHLNSSTNVLQPWFSPLLLYTLYILYTFIEPGWVRNIKPVNQSGTTHIPLCCFSVSIAAIIPPSAVLILSLPLAAWTLPAAGLLSAGLGTSFLSEDICLGENMLGGIVCLLSLACWLTRVERRVTGELSALSSGFSSANLTWREESVRLWELHVYWGR